jgi:hypothetical protein
MILGLALFTPLAIVGAVFYLVHHIIVKANLFLVAGVAKRIAGSTDLSAIGGLYKTAPLLGVLFLIPAFSLAGFPPLSGFWAKYVLVKASLDAEAYWIAAVALVVGLLTIYSMTKIWGYAFWKPHPAGHGAEAHVARPEGPRGAACAHCGAGGPDLHHRVLPRTLRRLRGALGRAASRPDRLRHGRSGRVPEAASGWRNWRQRMNIFALNIALAVAWAALTGNITLSGWSSASPSAPPACS